MGITMPMTISKEAQRETWRQGETGGKEKGSKYSRRDRGTDGWI